MQSDKVQKYITLKIIENIPYVDDLAHSAAKVVAGGVGVWVPEIVNQKKQEVLGAATDAAKDVAAKLPEPAKSAASSAAKSAAGAAKGVANRVAPPAAEPLGAMSDIAKDL